MLVLALITSAIVLAVATKAVVYGGSWVARFVVLGLALTVVLPLFMFVLTPTVVLAMTLFAPVLARGTLTTRRQRVLALGIPCLIALGSSAWFVWQDARQLAKLREAFPLVSLETRLVLQLRFI